MEDRYPLVTIGRALVPGTAHRLLVSPRPPANEARAVAALRRPGGGHHRVGTIVRILEQHPVTGGAMAHLEGESLVHLGAAATDGTVETTAVDRDAPVPGALLAGAQRALRRYMAARAEGGEKGDVLLRLSRDPVTASHEVASRLRVSWPEVQEILEAGESADRLQKAIQVMTRETELLRQLLGREGSL